METFIGLIALVVFVIVIATRGSSENKRKTVIRPNRRVRKNPVIRENESSLRSRAQRAKVKASSRLPERSGHAPPPHIPSSKTIVGRAWVIDGDTIAINRIKIRLAGIDAPELNQPWGQKSKWKMVNICKGKTIHVELSGETSYDRLVGTCYLPDGTDIGAEIIKAGLALDGSYYSKGKYLHLEPEGVRQQLKFYGLAQGK